MDFAWDGAIDHVRLPFPGEGELMADGGYAHHVSTLVHVPGYLIERGVDPAPLFRQQGVGLAEMVDPDGWLPRANCLAIAAAAEAATGDSFLGVRQAQRYELEHLGAWGDMLLAAPDLRAALHFACASIGLLESGTRIELSPAGSRMQLFFRFEGAVEANPRQHIEASLAVLRKVLLLAGEADAIAFHSRREASRGAGELECAFGPDLTLSADEDRLEFDRGLLDLQLAASPDPKARAYLETVRRADAHVREMLPYERPTVEGLARRLGIPLRTLQRRLRQRGFTFETLLDDIRRDGAMEMIAAGMNSITETAFLLGYSDAAHFTRAFRRWTGRSPREFARAAAQDRWHEMAISALANEVEAVAPTAEAGRIR